MTVKVNGKEFQSLKEAQDYSKELKADPNYVAPVQTKLEDAIDLAAQVDCDEDEKMDLAEGLDESDFPNNEEAAELNAE